MNKAEVVVGMKQEEKIQEKERGKVGLNLFFETHCTNLQAKGK
jgi:hypothetical protein